MILPILLIMVSIAIVLRISYEAWTRPCRIAGKIDSIIGLIGVVFVLTATANIMLGMVL